MIFNVGKSLCIKLFVAALFIKSEQLEASYLFNTRKNIHIFWHTHTMDAHMKIVQYKNYDHAILQSELKASVYCSQKKSS